MTDEPNIYPPGLGERPPVSDLDEVQGSEAQKAHTLLVALCVCLFLLLLYSTVLTTVNTTLIRHTQVDNKSTINNTSELVDQQKDCLQPEGKCFKASQRRLAKVLGSVRLSNVQINSATVACTVARIQAHQTVEYHAILACVKKTVRLQHAQ